MRARAEVVVAVVCGAWLCGCAPRPALPPPPAVLDAAAGAGVTVRLRWDAAVDLDLYVTDPTLETAYFANRRVASGGELVRDATCANATGGTHEEVARWTTPPRGRYRIGVDFLEACGSGPQQATYRITADAAGRRTDHTGVAHLGQREPLVIEFEVP